MAEVWITLVDGSGGDVKDDVAAFLRLGFEFFDGQDILYILYIF